MTPPDQFKAIVLEQADGGVAASIQTLDDDALPDGDVTIGVSHSSLNYKDGMVMNGLGRLVRDYPHVPGVDLVGAVEHSDSPDFAPGDAVILTGWRVGEIHWGGYATRARVRSEWLVKKPDGLSPVRAMAIGTAGVTAMMAIMALEEHGLTPESEGEVLVTGAAGGVGSVAVAVLAALGYKVAAGTGRASSHDYLKDLGAHTIVSRGELETPAKGPLGSERWAGAIDNVGGVILGNLLAGLRSRASCAAVGLAASPKLETTVLPFLLRGINLLGIDSVTCPTPRRIEAWRRLTETLPMDKLDEMTTVVGLGQVIELGKAILKGQVKGRTVVDVRA
ncbi:MDR family oxidoreductase [Varunaivibrio sulfuroxidans]|uniref:Acrylyl-CoA reductase (NADPH) n=1 Tax=Varunaivibrio sulfuroxidans TaxID=1773489 RepID=A0A4R3JC02_9PROT|nr:MDR family oxidoreductase [Varunaivibrio sulfuroxidans]TCS62603.1 acrylyl-CoA reductase (NADPH) [Varunaivibrio sulfuroxidans]WES30728.1 oxidoreductase [Varunaivibrio sulfuroxidans]